MGKEGSRLALEVWKRSRVLRRRVLVNILIIYKYKQWIRWQIGITWSKEYIKLGDDVSLEIDGEGVDVVVAGAKYFLSRVPGEHFRHLVVYRKLIIILRWPDQDILYRNALLWFVYLALVSIFPRESWRKILNLIFFFWSKRMVRILVMLFIHLIAIFYFYLTFLPINVSFGTWNLFAQTVLHWDFWFFIVMVQFLLFFLLGLVLIFPFLFLGLSFYLRK